jgi:UDP-N-acetylmuramate--alanine ligase
MYRKNQHIHFVGIGGIGMSGIAELLADLGYKVSGSDLRGSSITDRLARLGCEIHIGHQAQWVETAEVVVISSAVRENNPEVVAARERGIPVIMRAEMLAELMRLKSYGIAVAGSHGKTTTTSMLGWIMAQAGLDPTIVVGGKVDSLGGNAILGTGEFIVAEADESDGSFLKLSPVLEIVTNIDLEHLDYYRDIHHIKDSFVSFINKVPFYGAAVVCLDNEHVASILPAIKKRTITYGLTPQSDLWGEEINYRDNRVYFTVRSGDAVLGTIDVAPPGLHNVYNALATVGVGRELGLEFSVIAGALRSFQGVQRRMQCKGVVDDIMVMDDYGHHPTEIRATLAAIRHGWPDRRLVVLFQPHRYSRTRALHDEFLTCFHQADIVVVTDIYAAGEEPIKGVSGASLVEEIARHGQRTISYVDTLEAAVAAAADIARPYDIVLTLGAGTIVQAGEQLLTALSRR